MGKINDDGFQQALFQSVILNMLPRCEALCPVSNIKKNTHLIDTIEAKREDNKILLTAGDISKGVNYATYVEYGTSKFDGFYFMKNGVIAGMPDVKKDIAKYLANNIKKNMEI